MQDFIFSVNVTLPVFLVMVIGYVFRRCGLMSESFASQLNKFVFKIALPVNLFRQMCTVDMYAAWDTSFVLFCALATIASIAIATILSLMMKDRSARGEFIQGAYRSSASLLGMVYINSIYGDSAMGPLMMIGSVPLYNICAVIILTLTAPTAGDEKSVSLGEKVKASLVGIVTNPIILSIFAGMIWALLKLPMPTIADKTISYIGGTSSALGLLALGAMVDFGEIKGEVLPMLGAVGLKLGGFAALFVPMAVALGFRNDKLVAILIMLTSACTVTSFTMAKNMGHKGNLSSSIVMVSTLLSSVTLTFWIYLLRSRGLI